MRRMLTVCRTGLAGVAAAVVLTACGGGDGTSAASSSSPSGSAATSTSTAPSSGGGSAGSSEFCTQASQFIDQVRNADLNAQDPKAVGNLLTQAGAAMRRITPPAEIATDWSTLADAIEQLGTAYSHTDFNDPQQAASFQQTAADLQARLASSSARVENYLRDQCGIDTGTTPSAAPTS